MKIKQIFLGFLFLFEVSNKVSAQTLQENGLYAGTFWVEDGRFPISFFIESLHQVEVLQRLTKDSIFLDKFSKVFSAYDAIVITSHPDSISDMKINSRYATFAPNDFIERLSRGITKSSEIENGCLTLPFFAVSVEGNFVAYSIFVHSDDSGSISDGNFEKCLRKAAEQIF
jgi:hypothetical protein